MYEVRKKGEESEGNNLISPCVLVQLSVRLRGPASYDVLKEKKKKKNEIFHRAGVSIFYISRSIKGQIVRFFRFLHANSLFLASICTSTNYRFPFDEGSQDKLSNESFGVSVLPFGC